MARGIKLCELIGCGQWFDWMVSNLERKWSDNWYKEIWGRSICPVNGQRIWRYLCPIWMPTKGWPQQMRILIIKWTGWPILWICASFPSHYCHCPMGSWTVTIMAEVKIIHGLSNMELHSPRLAWLQPLLSAQPFSGKYNTEFLIWHHSMGWSASYLVAGLFYWTASIMDRVVLCSYYNRHPGHRAAFPASSISAKTTICGFTECLIHRHGIPHNIVSDQGVHFTANEVRQRSFTGITIFSIILKQKAW